MKGKNMKRVLILMMMASSLYGFVGLGLTGGTNSISHSAGSSSLLVDDNVVGSFSYDGFDNATSIGGYLYIDALPIVDVDIEVNVKVAPYYFNFNQLSGTSSQDSLAFSWASASFYMTVQKDLLKTSIPFLAKMRMFAGAGLNNHSSTPMVNQEMLDTVMGGDVADGTLNSQKMIDYLNENKIATGGFHIQLGAQFKLLVFDSMLIYRHVFTDGITPDTKGFGNLNLRFGYGL
jgi:hypothetical protein